MERCDCYEGGVRDVGRCDSCQECDSPNEVCQLMGNDFVLIDICALVRL